MCGRAGFSLVHPAVSRVVGGATRGLVGRVASRVGRPVQTGNRTPRRGGGPVFDTESRWTSDSASGGQNSEANGDWGCLLDHLQYDILGELQK